MTPTPPPSPCRKAKYLLKHAVRTHLGANDDAYNCVYQVEDDSPERVVGVRLRKELMVVAGQGLKVGTQGHGCSWRGAQSRGSEGHGCSWPGAQSRGTGS